MIPVQTRLDLLRCATKETPLVRLAPLISGKARIYAKCEFMHPSGSHKDRLYQYSIEHLETKGLIRTGMTLIDFSSGNAGAALALVGTLKGYKVIIVRPSGLSRVKAIQILSYGASIVFTPAKNGVSGAREKALELNRQLGSQRSYLMFQTESPQNPAAYHSCGSEIVRVFRRLRQRIDAVVCPVGTGGTLTGIASVIRKSYSEAKIVAIELEEAAIMARNKTGRNQPIRPHHIEGISTGELYPVLDRKLIDRVIVCNERQALAAQQEIIRNEKLLVGPSSGASLFGARKIAAELGLKANVVTVFWDCAWKYFPETKLPDNIERHISQDRYF